MGLDDNLSRSNREKLEAAKRGKTKLYIARRIAALPKEEQQTVLEATIAKKKDRKLDQTLNLAFDPKTPKPTTNGHLDYQVTLTNLNFLLFSTRSAHLSAMSDSLQTRIELAVPFFYSVNPHKQAKWERNRAKAA